MSDHPAEPLNRLDEDLVAYLDGESDADSARRLEQLLEGNPDARGRLRGLERAWDALDELPLSRASESFASSTVEMIALSEMRDSADERSRAWLQRLARAGLAALMLAAIASLGYAITTRVAARRDGQLLEHLPLVERLDQYRQVDDPEFLRALAERKWFEPAEETP